MASLPAIEFAVALQESRRILQLLVTRNNEVVVANEFDSGEIDDLIALLGRARAEMEPPVPEHPEPGAIIRRSPGGMAIIQAASKLPGERLLLIRDGSYGWIALPLSREDATSLARQLAPDAAAGT